MIKIFLLCLIGLMKIVLSFDLLLAHTFHVFSLEFPEGRPIFLLFLLILILCTESYLLESPRAMVRITSPGDFWFVGPCNMESRSVTTTARNLEYHSRGVIGSTPLHPFLITHKVAIVPHRLNNPSCQSLSICYIHCWYLVSKQGYDRFGNAFLSKELFPFGDLTQPCRYLTNSPWFSTFL